jgi:ABC-2 type transport system ATP-binding protein
MIEVRALTKMYGQNMAIDHLSFTVKKGEVVGFLGPNGAGKSTTMKIITGYMAPSSGEARVAGFDVFDQPLEVKKRIGYLPETPPVYGDMYVRDYLSFVAELKGVPKAQIRSSVDRALEKTNLQEVHRRLIQNLSKGFRQRVGIAQALVSDPEVLILDEPTVGLDPKQVAEIRELILQLKGPHTIILSTHILPEVQATCERIIIINKGKIVAQDSLENLSNRRTGSVQVYLRLRKTGPELIQILGQVPGVRHVQAQGSEFHLDCEDSEEMVERVADAALRQKWGLLEVRAVRQSLEDVFLDLTYGQKSLNGGLNP